MSGGAGTVQGSNHCRQWSSVEEHGSGAGPAIQDWPRISAWSSALCLLPFLVQGCTQSMYF